LSLIDRLGENYKNVPDILAEYEKGLNEVEAKLKIEGKRLEVANHEHASEQFYYESRKADLRQLVKYFEGVTAAARGKLFRKYTEKYSRELSDRQKDKYIDNEKEYLTQYEIYLEIKQVYEKYEAVCDAFRSRGYALNNITKIRVASLEDVII
jgi:hypothetical protein